MLEERISTLIQSIDCLTAVINRLWDEKDNIRGVKAPEISAEPPETENAPVETAFTHDEIHKRCLSLVRDDSNAKKKIQSTLKKYKAELVKDLPVEKLESFAADLGIAA